MRRGSRQLAQTREGAKTLHEKCGSPEATLPLFTYYQSTRFAQSTYFDQKFPRMAKVREGRLIGFADYLSPLSNAARFNRWYETQWRAVHGRMADGRGIGTDPLAAKHLSSVRTAVQIVLGPTGWSAIDWDDEKKCVVVEHADRGPLPLSWLSSGIRSMVALTADLAHRCASLNPHLGGDAAAKTPGLVLIDEVDLHLHPSWQQRVVELLQSAFGEMQLVLTTHSPQVLSTVYAESVRVVKHYADESYIVPPDSQTRGVESADVLAQIMGVDPIPQVTEARDLQRFRAMIEDGTNVSDAGAQLRERLLEHFGEDHPLMLDCARLERFVAFKRWRKKEGGGNAQA
jgi:predicted ATP-binding protein involved in virulence